MIRTRSTVATVCAAVLWALASPGGVCAGTLAVLHAFGSQTGDGREPVAGVIADKAGNLYSTTDEGGGDIKGCYRRKPDEYGCGTIYKIAPDGTETILYNFTGAKDGRNPSTGLLSDKKNNLYGTNTTRIFRLASDGTETTLFKFNEISGFGSSGDLVRDNLGNLFGANQIGGSGTACSGEGCGTVYQLTPNGDFIVLYTFSGGTDGSEPFGGLIRDDSGNLYGTTGGGGTSADGTVFEVLPDGTEKVLYSFAGGNDGEGPRGGVIMDKSGDIYGITAFGGAGTCEYGCGTVFRVVPDGAETLLHTFVGGSDGENPTAGLIMDKAGNLYGTTTYGGGGAACAPYGCGTIFKVAADGSERVLYSFSDGSDGALPGAALLMDKQGNLYGTASVGGTYGYGVVFKFSP